MLFEKKMDPRCAYCQRCAPLDEESVMCIKRGVVPAGFHCRAFKYDPLILYCNRRGALSFLGRAPFLFDGKPLSPPSFFLPLP